ncbi:hypothetical protein ACJRO7_031652 [Eucalyptus globulus]|uniref:ACT domain-containing protein n=1 Tax=Eucalyptus globulus TaxID=34317 RepID=A0ABD3JLS7_EUCGL
MTEAMIRKKPGMVSVKDMPVLQDGPPPGGFAPVRYARRIPNTGPSATAIFLAAFGAFSWGMYQVGQGNKIRRALKEEKYAARRAILPVLQAEEDERFVKEWKKYLEYEAEVMKDVPGWKVGESVYHSGRWVPPSTGESMIVRVSCHRRSSPSKWLVTLKQFQDYMEDYEVYVPFQSLQALGCHVDAVCPKKKSADFEGLDASSYDALVIPGGRAPEYLALDGKVIALVKDFMEAKKSVASICHGQQILVAAGVLKGKKCTTYPSVKLDVVLAGATWLEPDPIDRCFTDGNLVIGVAWPSHPEFIFQLMALLGIKSEERMRKEMERFDHERRKEEERLMREQRRCTGFLDFASLVMSMLKFYRGQRKWQRNKYVGVSLVGKTLAIMGFGKVGSEVARRAKGLARAVGVELVGFDEAIATADFISLHMPLTPATSKVLNNETFAKMKKGVRIVNVARGGVINEEALVRALDAGTVAQPCCRRHFMSSEEPLAKDSKLVQHERVTVIPHLGASTTEAQEGVAIEIAEAVIGALKGELAATAVNAPMVPAEVLTELKPFVVLAEKLGTWEWCKNHKKERVILDGSPESPLEYVQVQIANVESRFASAISDSGEITVEGRVKDGIPHLTKVGYFEVDVTLEGSIILCRQVDQPGMIGTVGSILGEENVNVSFMSVGRIAPRKQAVMFGVDDQPSK